jgi:hypothetical protein
MRSLEVVLVAVPARSSIEFWRAGFPSFVLTILQLYDLQRACDMIVDESTHGRVGQHPMTAFQV